MTPSETRPVLVLGAGGQVGEATLAVLEHSGCPVVGLSHGQVDIVDPVQVDSAVARIRPSVVINAAAFTAVDAAETDEAAAFAVNGAAAGVVARAARLHDAALIHLSTDYVFDGEKGQPYVEGDVVNPLSIYGSSKLAGERAVFEAGGKGILLRTSWLLGPRSGFVRAILNRAERGEPLQVVGDQWGRPTLVADLAQALAVLARSHPFVQGIGTYHYAGSADANWFEIAQALTALWSARTGRSPPPVRPVTSADWKAPARRPPDSRLDSTSMARDFGLSGRDWREGMPSLVDAWLKRESR